MHGLRLDHATINTTDLRASLAFYERFLGMKPGWRPPFAIGGAWLYAEGGDYPILHIVERARPAEGGNFDHIAFRGSNLGAAYLAKLKDAGETYEAQPVPETGLVQVHHRDPNGVLIEVNFEGEPLAAAAGHSPCRTAQPAHSAPVRLTPPNRSLTAHAEHPRRGVVGAGEAERHHLRQLAGGVDRIGQVVDEHARVPAAALGCPAPVHPQVHQEVGGLRKVVDALCVGRTCRSRAASVYNNRSRTLEL